MRAFPDSRLALIIIQMLLDWNTASRLMTPFPAAADFFKRENMMTKLFQGFIICGSFIFFLKIVVKDLEWQYLHYNQLWDNTLIIMQGRL